MTANKDPTLSLYTEYLTDEDKFFLKNHLHYFFNKMYAKLWDFTQALMIRDELTDTYTELKYQRDTFCYVFQQLLQQGQLKIARKKQIVELPVEEVIKAIYHSFPKEPCDDLIHFIVTPGNLVWIDKEKGTQLWLTETYH